VLQGSEQTAAHTDVAGKRLHFESYIAFCGAELLLVLLHGVMGHTATPHLAGSLVQCQVPSPGASAEPSTN